LEEKVGVFIVPYCHQLIILPSLGKTIKIAGIFSLQI